jgi:hypothetical protein
MSSFHFTARHKESGGVHEIWAVDNYFGRHEYGYIPNDPSNDKVLTEEQFEQQYDIVEPRITIERE